MSHSEPTCAITGCALTDSEGYHYWGDLHMIADTYIFNGVDAPLPKITPTMRVVQVTSQVFERRRLWVFHKSQATFNETAEDFLNEPF